MDEIFAGRYELIDQIGAGGMGEVWRVRDLKSKDIVAAKVLRQSDAASLLRFVREQAVRIEHPHVVVPLGWAGEDDQVLFTMPVIDGGSVATLIGDHGPIPPLFVAEIMRQLLDALSSVHSANLVHRDVKPANVLLAATGTGRPHSYLSDFGIALDLGGPRFTQVGHVMGTPGYLAPELTAMRAPTPAIDLYGVGRVAAAMLLGGDPPVKLAGPPPGVPHRLWILIYELCLIDPSKRPTVEAAKARLSTDELAWRPEGIGEVEVFRHVGPTDGSKTVAKTLTSPVRRIPPRVTDFIVLGTFGFILVVGVVMLLGT